MPRDQSPGYLEREWRKLKRLMEKRNHDNEKILTARLSFFYGAHRLMQRIREAEHPDITLVLLSREIEDYERGQTDASYAQDRKLGWSIARADRPDAAISGFPAMLVVCSYANDSAIHAGCTSARQRMHHAAEQAVGWRHDPPGRGDRRLFVHGRCDRPAAARPRR